MHIQKVRIYGHLCTLASMMGKEGISQESSNPDAWVSFLRSFLCDIKSIIAFYVILKVSVKMESPGDRDCGPHRESK